MRDKNKPAKMKLNGVRFSVDYRLRKVSLLAWLGHEKSMGSKARNDSKFLEYIATPV